MFAHLMLALQDTAPVVSKTLGEYLEAGGPMMVPIIACSVLALAFSLERYLNLRRGKHCPAEADEALAAVQGGRLDAAREWADRGDSTAARVLAAGLRREGFTTQEVEKAMEDQAFKESEKMRGRIRGLQVIASVAPLMGLLGTVMGIADAFSSVVQEGLGKPEYLAAGIEEALTTTIAGLIVAIPVMLFAAHLGGKVRRLLLYVDEKLAPAVEFLALRPGETRDAA